MIMQPMDPTPPTPEDLAKHAAAFPAGGAATQHTLRNIRLILGREYTYRVKQRSFIITSVGLMVVIFLAAFIPTIVQEITSGTPSQTRIVVVNEAGAIAGLDDAQLAAFINKTLNGTTTGSSAAYAISSQPPAALDSLQSQVKQGQLDMLLVVARATNQDLRFTYDTSASAANDTNLPTIQGLAQLLTFLDTAQRLGLTSQETQRLVAPPDMTVVYSQQSQTIGTANGSAAGFALAFAGVILIFVSIQAYAAIVAAGVAEEKSSRVMEILVTAATPFQLLAGKVVGIGAACLTQMGAVVVVGIVGLLLQTPLQAALFGAHAGGYIQYLTSVSVPFYLLFLLYFLLAFFLYATLVAGLASLVKGQQEVQSTIIPPMLLLSSGYVLFFFVVATPDAPVTKVLSYIPFWSPMWMLMRLALGTVAWWEIVVTVALMLLTILGAVWIAARLYRLGVLLYGQRPGLTSLVKLVRMG